MSKFVDRRSMDNLDEDITATISTIGRTNSTLPLTISAILNQTLLPSQILIYDDNESLSVISSSWWSAIKDLADCRHVKIKVVRGKCSGQVANHQQALSDVKTSWIWRNDDDAVPEPTVLYQLRKVSQLEENVAALGPMILLPPSQHVEPSSYSSQLEDIYLSQSLQHCATHEKEVIEVDHLQGSSFLFKRQVRSGYHQGLSRVGHREETMFTHSLKGDDQRLLFVTNAVVHHLHYPHGGIRTHAEHQLFEHDESIFEQYLEANNITLTNPITSNQSKV